MTRPLPDDPQPWTVLSSEYLSRKFWYTVRVDRVQLPGGTIIPEYWVNEYAPWVNVVAVTADGLVLLVRQYRHGLGQVHYEIPAGTTDPGDTSLEAAARRELLEETGYGGGRWSPLMTLSANPALTNNLTYTFLAEDVVRMAEANPGASEDLRLHPMSVGRVERLLDDGEMIQSLHVAPLMKFLLKRHAGQTGNG
ncbi:MAG TPA: NUDIX hydrolase [Polyangia bacterium]|nr:NUDIX hydrolase [Polyangia bacterium]